MWSITMTIKYVMIDMTVAAAGSFFLFSCLSWLQCARVSVFLSIGAPREG